MKWSSRKEEKLFVAATSKVMKMVGFEIVLSFVFFLVVKYFMVEGMWDNEYLDIVKSDWQQGPITDIQVVNQLDDSGNVMSRLKECPTGYEKSAEATWWGLKQGCICREGGYPKLQQRACDAAMLNARCTNAPEVAPFKMSVIDGSYYCVKRDPAYNFYTIKKPKIQTISSGGVETNTYKCTDPTFSKICGKDTNLYSNVYCIPAESECPVRSFSLTERGQQVILNTDASNGAPLIEIQMSEGGQPCLHDDTEYNA